jgi:hypothetical protein
MTCYAATNQEEIVMTEEQKAEFERIARTMMDWLCANGHPHMTILIDQTHAELLEGCVVFTTTEYLRN